MSHEPFSLCHHSMLDCFSVYALHKLVSLHASYAVWWFYISRGGSAVYLGIVAVIVYVSFVFGPCFVVRCLVSFSLLQSSC